MNVTAPLRIELVQVPAGHEWMDPAAAWRVVRLSAGTAYWLTKSRWMKGSGDKRWDDSVKRAVAETKTINRPPPKGFPDRFTVRFDVETTKTESVFQLSSR